MFSNIVKILSALLFSVSLLQASEYAIAAQIIDKTLFSLFPTHENVTTWANTPKHKEIIKHSTKMQPAVSPEEAQFHLVDSHVPETTSDNSILFSTDIELFYNDARVIGAFYWQKGRPNLIFLQQRLEQYGLKLSSEFNPYIEDSL